ncbi:MAG: choice-of-anchor D domain-containing protein [Haliscomenobacter sp.]|nr:choice-of-anchor D domain-containing protein [Haliscomenobacter sp.]
MRTYTVQNTGTVNLTLGAITITGVDASLFTLGPLSPASPIAPGGTATFTVTFAPNSVGLKTATVHIANDDCDEADYDFAVQGTGVASSPILGTYPNTSLVAGTNVKITPSAVPINVLSIVAYTNTNFTGTLFVNPTTGVLTVTDANQVGVYTVTVKAFGTGGLQTTSVFTLTVIPSTCSQFASTGSSPVPVGDYPLAIAIGDFNNDGLQDIATANSNNFNHSVSIRMGDGTGSFTGNTTIPVGEDPYSVAIGDFNGDGKQDFATANYTSNSVSIRLGDGSGGFSGSTEIPVGGGAYGAYAVAIGDFNGDGKQDIAAANGTDGTVSILIGDGSGGFSVTATLSVGSSPSFVAIGDFNADSYQDLAVVNIISNSVSILLGNGIGSFTASPHVPIGGLPVGSSPYSVAIGDFNGDNLQDLAVANIQDKSISIRLGDGLGGFSGSLNIPALAFPYIVAIADFNSDNKQDIAFSNSGGFDHTISIRFGDGSGSFSGNTNVPIGNNLITFAVGDLNNDGKLDLVAANYNVGTVSSRLGEANEINVQGNSTTITAGDATPNLADDTDFGAITAGSNLVRTFTIQNTANASLSIDAITMSGPNAALFTASAVTPVSPIPAGNSATFSVTFKPLTAGTKLATVTIANDDCDEASYDFAIQGEGVGNCVNPTFTLCPSAQTVTTPTGFCAVAVSYTATATGTSTPTFSYLFSGATTGSGSGTGSGSSFNIGITNVVITATDNCGSNTCLFTITVKSPEIDVQGNSISIVKGDFSPDLADLTDFGSVIVGSKLVQTFTIQNTGNANLTIYDIEVIGLNAALFIVDPLSTSSPILPGNSAPFTITFKPTTTGLKTTTVYIANNTCNEGDYDFTIQGTGVPAFAPGEESSLTDQSHVDELAADNFHFDFAVYPNPSNNQITVDLLNPNLNLQRITILDVVGKILVEKEVIENQVGFDIHSLPSGVYFVKVETNEGKKGIRKFVKSN